MTDVEHHTLADGTRILLRPIRPDDAEALREGFERLSPRSRYRRFLTPQRALTSEMVRYLTEVDGERHIALVAGVESPDLKHEEGIGVARLVRLDDEPDVAEAAVTVIDDYQNRGLGKLLLAALLRAASDRGIKMIRAEVLASNEPIQHLLARAGAVERSRSDDSITYDVPIARAIGDGHEGRLEVFLDLLRAAARSVGLLFRHGWFGRN